MLSFLAKLKPVIVFFSCNEILLNQPLDILSLDIISSIAGACCIQHLDL